MSVTMKPNQQKAVATAQRIMKAFDLGDLEWLITEHMDYRKDHLKLFNAVDSDYSRLEREQVELSRRLEKIVKTEQGKKALGEYANIWTQEGAIREMGFFYLGYAAAQRFLYTRLKLKADQNGQNSRRSARGSH